MERDALKRTSVFLTGGHIDYLKKTSNRSGTPVAEIVRRALDFYQGTEDKFRRFGLPMGELNDLLEAVRKEERAKHPSDPSSVEQKLTLIIEMLTKLVSASSATKFPPEYTIDETKR